MFETKSKMLTRLAVYSLSGAFLASCGGDDIGGGLSDPPEAQWELVWQDNFDGDSIDMDKWDLENNCWGGGNNELQCYTDRTGDDANAYVADGLLNIVARSETYSGPNVSDDDPTYPGADVSKGYTSARLRTLDLADWRFGRFEIRAKMPAGQGLWTGIWMLPTESPYGAWPMSGEIDIVETVNLKADGGLDGAQEDRVFGTTHYGRPWPGQQSTGASYQLPDGSNPADDFHTYSVEWEYGEIRWYVDGVHYQTQIQEESWWSQLPTEVLNDEGELEDGFVNAPEGAPFDGEANFYMLLNLAVGGDWAGNVNETGVDSDAFPATMQVDYVRVYRCSGSTYTRAGCGTGPNIGDAGETLVEADVKRPSLTAASFAPLPEYVMFADALAPELEIESYNDCGEVTTFEAEDSGDADHGQAFHLVKQNDGTGCGNAYFVISGGAGSLSHWLDDESGVAKLSFDVKVISKDVTTNMLIKIDSGWPNVSDMTIELPEVADGWQSYTLDFQELVDAGNSIQAGMVDIDAVTNLFVMEPTGGAIDVMFDNVRLHLARPPFVVFDEDFGTDIEASHYDNAGAGEVNYGVVASGDAEHGNVFEIERVADPSNVSVGFSETRDMSSLAGRTLVLDYKVTAGSGDLRLRIDSGWPAISDVTFTTNTDGNWHEYRIGVDEWVAMGNPFEPPGGAVLSSLLSPVVFEPPNGMTIQVDNIRFE